MRSRASEASPDAVIAGAHVGRRAVLRSSLACLAGLSLPALARFGLAAEAPGVTEVADSLVLLTGLGGNVLVLSTSQGQMLVDSGTVESRDALVAALAELPGASAERTLFNTHWHLDQVGSNEVIGREGGTIVAHEKTRLRLATDCYLPDEDRYRKALPAEARPTKTFYTTGETVIGGRSIEYGYLLEAHTDGDIYVHLKDLNVVAVGGAVSPLRDPELDWFGGGWLGGRVDSLALVLELGDEATRFVPSYGPVVDRAYVQAEHDMMLVLFERMVELVRKGLSPEDILAEGIMDDLDREWRDPLKFIHDAHKGLWAHHNTLSHDIV